ncbi:MAG: DUF1961 family protein [Armatimonadota bacterium]|nr:DUF1961 family protein [Armatimonadota bacterium]
MDSSGESINGPARLLDLKGRQGINPTSIHTAIKMVGGHTLNEPQGTLAMWFFALEDLAASFVADHMKIDNEFFDNYTFLSDFEVPRNYPPANFCFIWNRFNELRAKFFKGTVYPTHEGFEPPQKAWVQAVPFNYFEKYRWYQLAVTWDDAAKSASLFVNGVHLGTSDIFNKDFHRDKAGDTLYAGCPALCHGEMEFYDHALTGAELYAKYRAAAPDYDAAIEKELRHRFEGTDLEDFTFQPDANWTKQFDIDFQNPAEQIKEFYIQGHTDAVRPHGHPEGLLIQTPDLRYGSPEAFGSQVYIWSHKSFEGNIYVEFEWKALKPNGLSLLMVHASGMTREDFMADYPKKTSGTMQAVHAENVRNYHWEYYREMNDVRNDVGTAFSRKNPFAYRIGFGSAPAPFAINEWHKLQLVQNEGEIRGAIDGKILLEFDDNSRTNTGCILNYGHIAIRCMVHSALVFRNLKVYTDKLPFSELAAT